MRKWLRVTKTHVSTVTPYDMLEYTVPGKYIHCVYTNGLAQYVCGTVILDIRLALCSSCAFTTSQPSEYRIHGKVLNVHILCGYRYTFPGNAQSTSGNDNKLRDNDTYDLSLLLFET